MSIMFKTPNILSDITKQSHYDELDNYHDKTVEVQKTEIKLLRTLYRMIDEGIPLSQTSLMDCANVSRGTVKYYDYIFKDMVDMLCLFHTHPKAKCKTPNYKEAKELLDKYDIHDFETLESKATENIINLALTAGVNNDEYAVLADDLFNSGMVDKTFHEKALMPTDAAFSFLGQRYIHPDFVSLDINEMGKKVYQKYLIVQELKAEYDRLKAE